LYFVQYQVVYGHVLTTVTKVVGMALLRRFNLFSAGGGGGGDYGAKSGSGGALRPRNRAFGLANADQPRMIAQERNDYRRRCDTRQWDAYLKTYLKQI
jgi:hypothetical protein